jgi:N-acetylglucosaminyl-diphospho-decaprenol L-rhamnosyltransferase
VTIVLHDSAADLVSCIGSIRPELDDGFAELIAVDNDSRDDSVAVVRREAPGTTVLRLRQNRGFAVGANQAWPRARGGYWMLLNPDARLSPRALRIMAEWMDRHPTVGIGSAELRRADGTVEATGHREPSPWPPLLEASRLHLALPARLRGRVLRGQYWRDGDQTDAGWVPGTAVIVRRKAVEDVGLLDERFFLYGEDLEWCLRMRSAGWSIGVCTAADAVHLGTSSSSKAFTDDEVRRRIAEGIFEAIRVSRGAPAAKRYALASEIGQAIEARHPFRAPEWREYARRSAVAWREVRRQAPPGRRS